MMFHEVIDHRHSPNLCHHFFDTEADARAWIAARLPSARRGLQYIHREWGSESLIKCWTQDHRVAA